MEPSHLETLPPEQAALLIRKKCFWKRTMWMSLGISIFIIVSGVIYYDQGMRRMAQDLDSQRGLRGIAIGMDTIAIATMVFIPLSAFSFLLFLVSLIRILSLPKTPKPLPHVTPH